MVNMIVTIRILPVSIDVSEDSVVWLILVVVVVKEWLRSNYGAVLRRYVILVQ